MRKKERHEGPTGKYPCGGRSYYRIKVEGHLDDEWYQWFDGWEVTPVGDGTTVLTGPVADQAALHGLLARIRDLNLPLVFACRIRCGMPAPRPLRKGERYEKDRG